MGSAKRLGRRLFLTGLGAAAVTVTAGSSARAMPRRKRGSPRAAPPVPVRKNDLGDAPLTAPSTRQAPSASADVRAFLGSLTSGTRIGSWTVVSVHGIHLGAIPVVLADAHGRPFQVDVLRRDLAPDARPALSNTPHLSLFLSNRGDGCTVTDEAQGLATLALGTALAERERVGATVPSGLLTLRERRDRHPLGDYLFVNSHPTPSRAPAR